MVKEHKNLTVVNCIIICIIINAVCFLSACSKKQDLIGPEASFTYTIAPSTTVINGEINSTTPYSNSVSFSITNYDQSNLYYWIIDSPVTYGTDNKKATSQVYTLLIVEGIQPVSLTAANSFGTNKNESDIIFYSADSIARFVGVVNNSQAINSFKIDIYGYSSSYESTNILPWQTVSPAYTSAAFDFTIKVKNYGMIPRYNVKYKLLLTYKIGTTQYSKPQQTITLVARNDVIFN